MLVLIKKSLVDAREELLISNAVLLNQRCVSGSKGLVMVHTQNNLEATCDSFCSFADPLYELHIYVRGCVSGALLFSHYVFFYQKSIQMNSIDKLLALYYLVSLLPPFYKLIPFTSIIQEMPHCNPDFSFLKKRRDKWKCIFMVINVRMPQLLSNELKLYQTQNIPLTKSVKQCSSKKPLI